MKVNGNYVGKRPFISDFDNSFTDQEAHTVVSVRIRREREAGSIFIDINNVTSAAYSGYALIDSGEEAYSPSPAFNVTIGFERRF